MAPHADARFVWTDPHGTGRNRYVLFRRRFTLDAPAESATLHLFADTRYRLTVNGQVVAHGPTRFFLGHPEFDSHDLTPYLQPGENVLAVTVNSYGCVSFHSQASRGGLIAWGSVRDSAGATIDLATPGQWRGLDSPAHSEDTFYLSFALNPGEMLDARALPAGWDAPGFDDAAWPAVVAAENPDHWGPLAPRSIPPLDERPQRPRHRLSSWAGRPGAGEQVHSLHALARGGQSLHTRAQVAVLSWIHSPVEQQVTLGAWWGRYWVNGTELKPVVRTDIAMRQDFLTTLRPGWNELLVVERMGSDRWDFYLALPGEAGLSLSAEREIGSAHSFLVGGPWEGEQAEAFERVALPLDGPDALPRELGPWRAWPQEASAESPFHERAWLRLEALDAQPARPVSGADYAARIGEGGSLVLVYDFGQEVLGRPVVDFTAAEGTRVDLFYTERLNEDGSAYHGNHPRVMMAERTLARAGRQSWQTFHPRGFRYLEIVVTGDLSAFALHEVSLTRALYPVEAVGQFACSDPRLDDVWALGRDTQQACMEDAYLDCPWRERGLYSGDFMVQYLTNLASFGDHALMRRCVELFFQAQNDRGFVPAGAHGLPPGRHPDYTAILVQALWTYYAHSGDLDYLRACADRVHRLLAGLDSLAEDDSGLLGDGGMHPYVDLSHTAREGVNCPLNAFYQRAFAVAATVFETLGDADSAARYRARADALAEAIRRNFWDAERGLLLDRRAGDEPNPEPGVPGNVLGVLYDLVPAEAREGVVDWIAEQMLHNFRVAEPKRFDDFNISAYFSYYGLGVLLDAGRVDTALEFIRRYWGRMLDAGAWTCWEFFMDNASRCHAWATAPTHYLTARVLGVTWPEPGNPNRVRIAPQPGELEWAQGTVPHPLGPIAVRWHRRAGQLHLEYQVSEGVEVVTDDQLT